MSVADSQPAAGATDQSVLVIPRTVKVAMGVLASAFAALYFRWFWTQGQHSVTAPDDWGHAFVVPVISGYMLWKQRAALLRSSVEPFWPGLCPLLMGITGYFYFVVGVSNHMLQGLAMLLGLSGVVLLVAGLPIFRIAFLPLLYLVFGITVSEQVMIKVTFPLQLIATQGAWAMLKLISIPGDWFFVDAAGNTLELSYKGRLIPLNVAEACSGMRMVIAFIALAGAVAIFSCKLWWQRIAVVALAVPVAVFMNVFRVAVLALASLLSPGLAAGNAHMLIGTLLLIPGLFLFLGMVWALHRIVSEEQAEIVL